MLPQDGETGKTANQSTLLVTSLKRDTWQPIRAFMVGTSWKMAPFKCLVYGATFSCYKLIIIIIIIIIMMMIIIIIIIITTMISIMKIIIIIINRSADLKIGNAGINQ